MFQPRSIYSARSVDEFAFRPELAALESAGRIASYFTVTAKKAQAGRADAAGSAKRC